MHIYPFEEPYFKQPKQQTLFTGSCCIITCKPTCLLLQWRLEPLSRCKHMYDDNIYIHTCIITCMHICEYICIWVSTYVHMCVHIYTCTNACAHAYTNICTYMHIHIYVYVYIYVYIYIYVLFGDPMCAPHNRRATLPRISTAYIDPKGSTYLISKESGPKTILDMVFGPEARNNASQIIGNDTTDNITRRRIWTLWGLNLSMVGSIKHDPAGSLGCHLGVRGGISVLKRPITTMVSIHMCMYVYIYIYV